MFGSVCPQACTDGSRLGVMAQGWRADTSFEARKHRELRRVAIFDDETPNIQIDDRSLHRGEDRGIQTALELGRLIEGHQDRSVVEVAKVRWTPGFTARGHGRAMRASYLRSIGPRPSG